MTPPVRFRATSTFGTAPKVRRAFCHLYSRSSFGLVPPPPEPKAASARLISISSLVAYRPSSAPGYNPIILTPESMIRVQIRSVGGSKYGEITHATLGQFNKALNQTGQFSFTIPYEDWKRRLVSVNGTEVRVMIGTYVVWEGLVTGSKLDSKEKLAEFTCKSLKHYSSLRSIGRVQRKNLAYNPEFKSGVAGWAIQNAYGMSHKVVSSRRGSFSGPPPDDLMKTSPDGKALRLTTPTTLGYDYGYFQQTRSWTVADRPGVPDVFTVQAWAYIPSNIYGGPNIYGRGLTLQRFDTSVRGANVSTGVFTATEKYQGEFVNAPIDRNTPQDRWVRFLCKMEAYPIIKKFVGGVPIFEPQGIAFRLYSVRGTVFWTSVSLTWNERLVYAGGLWDQSVIANELVQHMQSEEHGKSDLNIVPLTPATGVTREETYLFSDRQSVEGAIDDLSNMERGFDFSYYSTLSTRYFLTHYPSKGVKKDRYAFVWGKNIQSYSIEENGDLAANAVTIVSKMAGDGSDEQVEVSAVDDTVYPDGLIIESVIEATPGSALTSLLAQARRALKRFARPAPIITITLDPTTNYYMVLEEGDTVPVKIIDGSVEIVGRYRIIDLTFDPTTRATDVKVVHESIAYDAEV